ncbi:hypothetical protein [Diaphorobacter sp. J5-51]|uniref:hypothetical protein n=1 Tax=Diaphorobacter sp. J5-51 TaxID=680496 RepID=UPI0012F911E2|nr:hypothetical protein [Diaphorobacter sp. J5-51]
MDQFAVFSVAVFIAVTLASLLFTYWFFSRIIAAGVRIGLTEARIRFQSPIGTAREVPEAPPGYRWELVKVSDR